MMEELGDKRCVECGTKVPTISDTPLCSRECQKDYCHRMVREMPDDDAWCPTCNGSFNSVRAVCYHHNKVHKFEIHRTSICEYCGSRFRPTNTENELKYCSEKCFGEAKSFEREKRDCVNCGETIIVRHNFPQKFCSHDCANEGEYHPQWEGGDQEIRKTLAYRKWRDTVAQQYDGCVECDSTENLHAHHIVPISENKELATDPENGIMLCADCHSNKHPDMADAMF
jgi:hypothetical protein